MVLDFLRCFVDSLLEVKFLFHKAFFFLITML